ncbi:unnamed protein product [Euphydryas editha]|nr:unnamed protein product [Euphydryas editha]
MRYFQNFKFWKINGPIYLFLGGENEVSPLWLRGGLMYELAKETEGAMFISEHRYYGASKPYKKYNTTDAEYLKYLTSRQALADIAKLLNRIKSLLSSNKSKVVVVGASYSANLAVWMRLEYPKLVDAVLASSGPVLAKKDFYEYIEKVSDNYERYGTSNCSENIKNIFSRYDRLFETADGIKQLKIEENICEECNLGIIENKQLFFSSKINEFMTNSQNGNTSIIKNHCQNLENSLQQSQNESIPIILEERNRCTCYNFSAMIEQYFYPGNEWLLNWNYQICTEFGYFQTLNSESQPFTNNLEVDYYVKTCSALFGPEFDEARVDAGVKYINELYGGLTPNVTKVVFTNGDLDPWSTISVTEDLSSETPAILIPRASHCLDIVSSTKSDSEELKEARKQVKYLIKKFIGVE